jgi:hypothetical protein
VSTTALRRASAASATSPSASRCLHSRATQHARQLAENAARAYRADAQGRSAAPTRHHSRRAKPPPPLPLSAPPTQPTLG